MLDKIIALKDKENSVKELRSALRQGMPSAVFGVGEGFKRYLVAALDTPVLYIVKDYLTAEAAARAVRELSGKKTAVLPAKEETLVPARAFSKELSYKRIAAIKAMEDAEVIITTAEAIMQPIPLSVLSFKVRRGAETSREELTDFLVRAGYRREETVETKGTFAVRGDVADVFAVNAEEPIRIDFFGDTVESVKTFDAETRKSTGFTEEAEILQAEEYVFEKDEAARLVRAAAEEAEKAEAPRRARLKELCADFMESAEKGGETLNFLAPLSERCGTVFDILKKGTCVIFDEARRVYESAALVETEFTERFKSLVAAGETFSFAARNCCGFEELKNKLGKYPEAALQTLSTAVPFFNPLKIINPKTAAIADYRLNFNELFSDVNNWLYSGYSVLICAGNARRAERLSIDLSERGTASSLKEEAVLRGAVISAESLLNGFVFHEEKTVVIGSGNLFSQSERKIAARRKKQPFFTAPEVGDYCVHEIHGVGKVTGSKKITTTEGTKDYVSVQYYGGDMLYVPVEQMDILTRYLGSEKHPKLSKIGGADFEKVKKSVRESIKKMSFDLKRLYEERESAEGFAFSSDEDMEKAFGDAFPFEETPDQQTADAEIKKDMESRKVMDRLICGDVGFGKTEVALRAVFRAVMNGKQAAMLAPTTILTEQHFNTAAERFAAFGVQIAVLNRFRTEKEQKKILCGIKDGSIDFVIGTHRLLSKDVQFRDLGLLILDEEQRFGVEHKEKIKLLKKNVDTLTLTATPIPRTLSMSLSGIRALSVIDTPPKKRLPVQTFVTEETDSLIKDAVLREVNRGGQAFILYNRVESIFTFAEKIRMVLPEVKFTVVHGRMKESVLEKAITEFYRGKTQVLISTTIIENGIDLPRANTLIVIDADRLGLSTLYQLKGRVGRSDRLAYAYFTFKRDKILSGEAYERLNAIIEFTEMGSGIKIAMRDLEIRGAGNVLGAEQHGHMDKIGYELYSKLLREELSGKEEKPIELDVRVSAFIPESYIEGDVARMDAYKEIAETDSDKAEAEFKEGLKDVYGDIPAETENLIKIAAIKRLALPLGVSKITVSRKEVSLTFPTFKSFDNAALMSAIDGSKNVRISMASEPKAEFIRAGESNEKMLEKMREFLSNAVKG